MMHLSTKGTLFVQGHEGFVSKAYRCPAGVITIGFGFTMGSAIFAAIWMASRGHALRMGDTITREEALNILPKVVDEEYGRAVNQQIAPKKQHHYDAASSTAFNCGTGSLAWRWAQSLKAGMIQQSAAQLRVTATTANGRTLPGLVRRRREEAHLIETGVYTLTNASNNNVSIFSPDITQYQGWLAALGFYKGKVDGINGPKTKKAVVEFQKSTNSLVVDGIVGPATRAAMIRAVDSKNSGLASAGSGSVVGVGTSGEQIATSGLEWGSVLQILIYGSLTLAVVFAAFKIYQYRGKVLGTGRVPT